MKFVIFIAVVIVAVSGKSLTANVLLKDPEFAQNIREMQNEFKESGYGVKMGMKIKAKFKPKKASIKADGGATVMSFMSSIDAETRTLIIKDSAKTITVIVDTTKPMQNKLFDVAEIAQNTADLWKLALKKYSETNPAPVTVAAPAA